MNPAFFKSLVVNRVEVISQLEFPQNWGLGSSSTLLYNLAQWAQVDAFQLSEQTFGGSGYDIACAGASDSILYQKVDGIPTKKTSHFDPSFKDQLYFVYLGQKQNSRHGIAHYRQVVQVQPELIDRISVLTTTMLQATTLADFEEGIRQVEHFISTHLQMSKAKDLYFDDYWGTVKSLGAWGGDFVMVSSQQSETDTRAYFLNKGFETFIPYREMILSK